MSLIRITHTLTSCHCLWIRQDGNTVVIDPGLKEEAAMQGRVTIMVNPNKEVCAVHKAGGVGLSSSQLFRQGISYVWG
jgi:exosome complex component RRP45